MTRRTYRRPGMQSRWLATAAPVLLTLSLLPGQSVAATGDVEDWLERMIAAVERYNYRGTMARRFNNQVEYMRVVHRYQDGQISERVETLDGADRTIIRDQNGVRCILPDSRAVLYQDSATPQGFVARLPLSTERMRGQYDLILVREGERVADRKTVQLALRPHDEYRYGHRVWLEQTTGLPLKIELLDELGRVIEETRFVSFELEESIADAEFELDINVAGFRELGRNKPTAVRAETVSVAPETWTATNLPIGFELTHTSRSDDSMTHLRFDDGMATVSVFIEPAGRYAQGMIGASKLGGTHAYSVQAHGRQITAVGEVPHRTARTIAESISRANPEPQ